MTLVLAKSYKLNLPDSDIRYFPRFFNLEQADNFLIRFKTGILWKQDNIQVYGKVHPQPRLTALYANNDKPYSYSNITMQPLRFTEELENIKQRLETTTETRFTSCLLNLYRDGQDSNGWHADDEKELGSNPVIASVSLGQDRFFHLKHKRDTTLKHKIMLEHGSLLLMQGATQHHWLHQIPKTSKPIGERINLTFRVIQ